MRLVQFLFRNGNRIVHLFYLFSLLLQTHPGVLTSRRAGRQDRHCKIKKRNECFESQRTVWGLRVVIDSQSYLFCADSKHCCSSQSLKVELFFFLFNLRRDRHEQNSTLRTKYKCELHITLLYTTDWISMFHSCVRGSLVIWGVFFQAGKLQNYHCLMNRHTEIKDKHNRADYLQTFSPFLFLSSLRSYSRESWGFSLMRKLFVLVLSLLARLEGWLYL